MVLQAAVIADAQGSLSRDKLRKANCGADVRLTQPELFVISLSQSGCRSFEGSVSFPESRDSPDCC
jgi:hypothetical protein